jgi:hypothetical protein
MKYNQCTLQRGNTKTVSWIPDKFAHIDKFLKLKGDDGWEDGWQVTSVGTAMDEKIVIARERDYKKTRKASDIVHGNIKHIK